MSEMPERYRPRPLPDVGSEEAAAGELADLAALAAGGLPLASVVVVPAAAEERFYRLNNLPQQLLGVFARVDPGDPDEDDVEEAAPEAQRLVAQHYLLDEFIDAFYAATAGLPGRVRVRRPGEDGEVAVRGRPALLALKHAYRRDWSADAVMRRVRATGAIALDARPVLVHDADEIEATPELTRRAGELLGRAVRLRLARAGGGVTRVEPATVPHGDDVGTAADGPR